MKSLKTKIMVSIGGVAILAMIISALVTINTVVKTAVTDEQDIAQLSTQAVTSEIDEYFTKYIAIADQIASNTEIRNLLTQATTTEQLTANPLFTSCYDTLKRITDKNSEEILSAYVVTSETNVGLDGAGWIPDSSFSLKDREYYFDQQKELDDGFIITEPYQDSDTGNMIITVAVPLYDSSDSKVIGVSAIDVTINELSDRVVQSKSNYKNAYKMLVSASNSILASKDSKLLLQNVEKAGFSQEMLNEIQKPTNQVIKLKDNGEACFGVVKATRDAKWKVIYIIPEKDFMKVTDATKRNISLVYIAAIIILCLVMIVVVKHIVAPLRKLTDITNELAKGNLDADIDINTSDETGRLADSMRSLVVRLRQYIDYIDEVSASLDEFAAGHLDIQLKQSYEGEFAKLKTSLLQVSSVFKDTIGRIIETSEKVASGSGQIANAAQMLAQGATNQASTTQELTATINELSERVTKNADQATSASEQVRLVGGTADQSNEQMRHMIEAIAEINEKSAEIGKIIKVIEDIAFQTNILALNAAVEAARAGEAGKGFAVVADEVRNLASKSAEAAKDTTHLIEETVKAVENGTQIANQTGEMLGQVIEGVSQTVDLINEISSASVGQATALKQTLDGVEQISSVVQTNAATAEESSAASDELSKQAHALQGVASQFKI
ncbi:methyl-accepting chemotaxis protein [Aminipila luticellarii]|uniref:Methyl-accepting chemotaxis protein n=1 Tax=Aminipila luticellarii TaxID=2507160 RepID=A0A410PXN5_9FIRM|nr:methyl-accepting chemotaxis protein [Aminipila luticellarii]QAT43620.1 methyl-accepting chemotaxis protein [Aminipila luticellarii]